MAGGIGGPLSMVGITPQFITSTVTSSISSSSSQLFSGVGNQLLLRQAGAAIVGNVASNVVNVGLNSVLGTQVAGASGLSLTSGANILASTITPYVTSTLAAGVNQSIQNSLKGAGPLAPVLSQIATGFVNQAANGLSNLLGGATTPGGGSDQSSKFFPGAGNEPDANYSGGNSYTLGSNGPDVVFAIRPANEGPAVSASSGGGSPTVPTSLPLTSWTAPEEFKPGGLTEIKTLGMGFSSDIA